MDIKRFVDKIKESGKSPDEIAKLFEDALKPDFEIKKSDEKDVEKKDKVDAKESDKKEKLESEKNIKGLKDNKDKNNGTFRSLNKVSKTIVAGSVVLGLTSAIVFPVLGFTVWKNNGSTPIYEGLLLSETSVRLTEGVDHKITVKGVPSGTNITWISTNENVVTVDNNGVLSASMPTEETAKIIAVAGNKAGVCTVNGVDLSILDFNSCSWSALSKKCDRYEKGIYTEEQFVKSFTYNSQSFQSLDDFVGKEKLVYLTNPNGTIQKNPHRVRVIDTNHDVLAKDNTKKAALTFEFANLISDDDGYSIGLVWHDRISDASLQNTDYPNSSLRKALYRNGTFSTNVYYTQKGSDKWSENYTNKTIFSMLPNDLQMAIKPVKKSVGTTASYVETSYNDELFIPSALEYGYTDSSAYSFGTPYAYYNVLPYVQKNAKRIKSQVNTNSIYEPTGTTSPKIAAGSGQAYEGYVVNYSGFNVSGGGGYYWVCSPCADKVHSYGCNYEGNIATIGDTSSFAHAIAPAFCL